MATQQEWKEYFELVNSRKPTLEEFQATLKNGEIDSESRAEQHTTGEVAGKKKFRKWIWITVVIVLALGIGCGIFGYMQYQKSQEISQSNVINYLKSHGYKAGNNDNVGIGDDAYQEQRGQYHVFKMNSDLFDVNFSPDGKNLYYIEELGKGADMAMKGKNGALMEIKGDSKGVWVIYALSETKIGFHDLEYLKSFSQIPSAK